MCTKYLGFVLLIWLPGILHAQSAAQPCNAPRLDGDFFAPNQDTYPHGTTLTYLCDKGRKPAVGGQSATSTCQNGNWTHEPQCIDETACTPPTIHNATYTESQTGWYENGSKIKIKCDNGYEHEDYNATARCENGEWSSLPVCETRTCGRRPVVSNGVLITDSGESLWYRCNVFYKLVGPDIVRCYSNGTWSEVPTCNATYCSVDTDAHPELKPAGNKFLKDGEKVVLECVEERWYAFQYAVVRCTDGTMHISKCCNRVKIKLRLC